MSALSLRYARAFSQVAAADGLNSDIAEGQLRDFAATFAASQPLREVLTDPSIPNESKLAVLDALAEKLGLSKQVRNFIAVIIEHGRLNELHDILTEYSTLADEQSGITEVEILSAHPLDQGERTELEQQAARLAGGRVRATYAEDPQLLGGAVVKIGSTVYDGSLRGQLEQMKRTLVGAASV